MKRGLGFMLKFIFYKRKNVLKKQGFYFFIAFLNFKNNSIIYLV